MTIHPAVDIATDQTLLVYQDRPVVPFSSWLADALATFAKERRGLQVVTPTESRITFPLRTLLSRPQARWVVEEPDGSGGHYDGLSGLPLVWDESSGYVPKETPNDPRPDARAADGTTASTPAPTFLDQSAVLGSHLIIDVTVVHPATDALVLGAAAEALTRTFTGTPPGGWGTSEPALSSWDRTALTDMCRHRAPQQTWLTFVGPGGDARPSIGTQRVSRVVSGVKEKITFAVAYAEDEEPALHRLEDIVQDLASQGTLQTLTAHRLPGRPDLTYEPHVPSVPTPVGLALGPEPAAETGLDHVLESPAQGHLLGPRAQPAVWFPLGDGNTPEGWLRFVSLMNHLAPSGARTT
ncbi:hypothetical protein CDO52_04975 [Nocardiopsis gilva YIM 90087]|uniref:Uncharacterized protein n=1 Tax=Nocardiopsis gilva YIM 90087 TaxID=1235441 RepID=A0A223S268_9ACTN|nr:DUF6177 family protein [Nocardiopsis gilva]ASU82223.1 hypothetical protein CDO52_04975 [Nocardiopsis gilva YIM 90087]